MLRLGEAQIKIDRENRRPGKVDDHVVDHEATSSSFLQREKVNEAGNRRYHPPAHPSAHRVQRYVFPEIAAAGGEEKVCDERKDPKAHRQDDEHGMNRMLSNAGWSGHN